MNKLITIPELSALEPHASQFCRLGDEYVYARLNRADMLRPINDTPFRINGLTWLLCLKGEGDVDINFVTNRLKANSLMVVGSDSIQRFHPDGGDSIIDCMMLTLSSDFLRYTNVDINVLSSLTAFDLEPRPVFDLKPEESEMLARYFEMTYFNTVNNHTDLYVRSISRNLIASMFYQVMQFLASRLDNVDINRPRSRRATYVFEFKSLVNRHHRRERSVGFYAQKMFISPKYLSLIIKEATGRSAAEWIDDMVIIEAKNLLRFSGKNIQQIAYDLNFTNQSSFGKYFKHLTGVSPTQYQRS